MKGKASSLLQSAGDDATWEHQRGVLTGVFGETDVTAALKQLPEMLRRVAQAVEQSKAKDDRRGARIIEDYADVHTPADKDKFVKQTWESTRASIDELQELQARLASG